MMSSLRCECVKDVWVGAHLFFEIIFQKVSVCSYLRRDRLSGYEKQVDATLLLKTRCHTALPRLITRALILRKLYYINYKEKFVISQSISHLNNYRSRVPPCFFLL